MSDVLKFKRKDAVTVDDVLEWAKEEDLNEIVVFGRKGDDVWLAHSEIMNITEIVGALERMKFHLLR